MNCSRRSGTIINDTSPVTARQICSSILLIKVYTSSWTIIDIEYFRKCVSKCCSQVYYLKFLAEPILTYLNDIYFYEVTKKIFIISVCDGVESKSLLFKICSELSKETFFLCVGQYLLVNLFNLQMYTES